MTTEEEMAKLRIEVKHVRAKLSSREVFLIEYMTDEGPGWAADVIGIHSGEGGALVEVISVARGLHSVNDAPRPVLLRPQGFGGTWIVQTMRRDYRHATRYVMRDGMVTPVEVRQTHRYHVMGGHWRIRRSPVNP